MRSRPVDEAIGQRATEPRSIEPAARLPLAWGLYSDRWMMGLVLIVGGLVHLQAARTENLLPLIVGSAAHMIGWLIMPATAWRRIVPLVPSTLVVWLLLTGPQFAITLSVTFAGWLIVRHRPWRSALALGPVLLCGLLTASMFREYDGMLAAIAITAVVLVVSAWWARALAQPGVSIPPHPPHPSHPAAT